MGLPTASAELVRRLRGGAVCGKGRLPPGYSGLARRRLARLHRDKGGRWCLTLLKKKRRR